jgi:hypothetical protein
MLQIKAVDTSMSRAISFLLFLGFSSTPGGTETWRLSLFQKLVQMTGCTD